MLENITEQELAENGVASAPDKLEGKAADNKKLFDKLITAVIAPYLNLAIDAINELEKGLRDHIDIDPTSVRDNNVSVTGERVETYGLEELANPTVAHALDRLAPFARCAEGTDFPAWMLSENTARRLRLDPATATPNEAFEALLLTEVDSLCGGLHIKAVYASTGKPAPDIFFTGLPGVAETMMVTDEYGSFFTELSPGEYTLSFRPVIGELTIPDQTVVVEAKKVSFVDLRLEAGRDLKVLTESGEYLVGQDAEEVAAFGIGGGGSGGASRHESTSWNLQVGCGGGSGFVANELIDLTASRGKFVRVLFGAGGARVIPSNGSATNGNEGGTTSITLPDGTVVLSAPGGKGGEGADPDIDYYNGKHRGASYSYNGGDGACDGAGVTVSWSTEVSNTDEIATITFQEDNIEGVRVFGKEEYPLVAGGGFTGVAQYNRDAGNGGTSISGAGCNTDGTVIDGTGAGGGGAVGPSAAGYAGASGAIYIE